MKTTTRKKALAWLITLGLCGLLIACGDAPSNNNNNNTGLCGSQACPKGQFCFNGICAVGCNTDNECESNQYCDTDIKQCANKSLPPKCPDTPCKEGQECVSGYCSAKATTPPKKPAQDSTACKPNASGDDGCGKTELCIFREEEKTQCRAFPPCSQDGKCIVGLVGAVCNEKLIEGKARICLVGMCKDTSHCPTNWKCIHQGQSVLGFCSDGSMGTPCNQDDECAKELKCTKAAPTLMGICFQKMPGIPDIPMP